MTAKEFLMRAYHLEQQINYKLEEIKKLEALATKATAALGGNRLLGGTRNVHSREKLMCSIIDMRQEADREVERLLSIRKEIKDAIDKLEDPRQRIILDMRYLCNKKWSEIASEFGYTVENLYVIHRNALKLLSVPKSL